MRREVAETARILAERLSRSGASIEEALRGVEVRLDREDACEMLERLKPLVRAYAAIEEGSLQPSAAYLALRPVVEVLERVCRGRPVDDTLVALALAVIGLLEAGKAARASTIAAVIETRLR